MQSKKPGVQPELRDAIAALLDWLEASGYPGTLVGGVAVGLHGVTRTTADIDLAVFAPAGIAPVAESLGRKGFAPRIDGALEFAEMNRVLLLVHTATDTKVDVMIGVLPFDEDLVRRSNTMQWEGRTVRFASLEFLCVMKLVAARPKDVQDVRQLLELWPGLDKDWVLARMAEMAELLEAPDRLEIARALLKP